MLRLGLLSIVFALGLLAAPFARSADNAYLWNVPATGMYWGTDTTDCAAVVQKYADMETLYYQSTGSGTRITGNNCNGVNLSTLAAGGTISLSLMQHSGGSSTPFARTGTLVSIDNNRPAPSMGRTIESYPMGEVAVFCVALLSFFLGFRTGAA